MTKIPTGSRSSPRSASPAVPSPSAAHFPPQDTDATNATWRRAIIHLLQRLNPMRRRRSNPHVVKRKMPKWHVKLSWHADWLPPTGPPRATIRSPYLHGIGASPGWRILHSAPIVLSMNIEYFQDDWRRKIVPTPRWKRFIYKMILPLLSIGAERHLTGEYWHLHPRRVIGRRGLPLEE